MTAALAYDAPATLTITSDLLGVLTVPTTALFTFPNGLLGFPECQRFVLLPTEREHIYWLQSADYPPLAFFVVDPFVFFPGYTVDLTTSHLSTFAASPDEVMVLSIVTLPGSPSASPTANLQGPLVINTNTHQAYQAVFCDSAYSIRESFTL